MSTEEFGDGFIDERVEDFSAGGVATDEVGIVFLDEVTVLVSTAPGEEGGGGEGQEVSTFHGNPFRRSSRSRFLGSHR